MGILLNNDGREYVIPLISGKDKHKTWADVTASWYRIYEVIDITEDPVRPDDVIVEITFDSGCYDIYNNAIKKGVTEGNNTAVNVDKGRLSVKLKELEFVYSTSLAAWQPFFKAYSIAHCANFLLSSVIMSLIDSW